MILDPNNNKTAYLMIMLGATMTGSMIGSIVIGAWCTITWQLPSLGMIGFFAWTAAISVLTWQLDKNLEKQLRGIST